VAPPTATRGAMRRAPPRRPSARQRAAARRRRRALAIVAIGVAVVAVIVAMPLFRKAVNEFTLPLTNADVIRQQAAEKHLDPALIAAVIDAETKFDPRPSPAGAEGLMQILPQTAEFLARRSGATTFRLSDLGTPQVNIAYGSYYLRFLLDHYGGDKVLALAAYNGGEANVDRWVADARRSGARLTIARIPFPETRAYVKRVLRSQHDYRQAYAAQLGYQ
jgi:soluble lytic murein transglycosylase